MHPKRHPITMTYTVGCDAEGRLTAVKARYSRRLRRLRFGRRQGAGARRRPRLRALPDAGGRHRVGRRLHQQPAVRRDARLRRQPDAASPSRAASTCSPPRLASTAGRCAGATSCDVGDLTTTGQVLEKSVGTEKTLLAVKPAYDAARAAGRAVGIACGLKNSGIGNGAIECGKCRLVVQPGGVVDLHTGFTEMGQGLLTVLTQCAVEVTGLPAAVFRPQVNSRFELGARPDDRLARHHARRTRGDRRRARSSRPTSTPGGRSPISPAPSTPAKSASTTPPRRAS